MTDARSSAASSAVFAGCEIHVIAGAGVAGRSFKQALDGLAAIAAGVLAARRILAPLSPGAVIGFGGYPAVAPVLAARSLRHRPALILHDQNAVLGKANRSLAMLVDEVALSFAKTGGLLLKKGRLTGNPVRSAIAARAKAAYAPPAEEIRLLVLGGSLGANAFAMLIPGALARLSTALRRKIVLTMQCPAVKLDEAKAGLAACRVNATVAPFFEDVAGLLVQAHLVIARAGGSTVAELAVIGRPAVLIPLRINNDQAANADALAAAGGAIRVEQSDGEAALADVLEALLADPRRLAGMAAAAAGMGIADAAARLAELTETAVAASSGMGQGS